MNLDGIALPVPSKVDACEKASGATRSVGTPQEPPAAVVAAAAAAATSATAKTSAKKEDDLVVEKLEGLLLSSSGEAKSKVGRRMRLDYHVTEPRITFTFERWGTSLVVQTLGATLRLS